MLPLCLDCFLLWQAESLVGWLMAHPSVALYGGTLQLEAARAWQPRAFAGLHIYVSISWKKPCPCCIHVYVNFHECNVYPAGGCVSPNFILFRGAGAYYYYYYVDCKVHSKSWYVRYLRLRAKRYILFNRKSIIIESARHPFGLKRRLSLRL